jgi:carboxymethylenebutenolidase
MGTDIKLSTTKDDVTAYLSRPENTAKGGVIVIHEVWGLNDHTRNIADRLAREGYIALAPELLGDTIDLNAIREFQEDLFNPEKRNEVQPKLRAQMTPTNNPEFAEETFDKIKACFDLLYDKEQTNQHVAIMGYCFGGSYSYSFAVHEPRLKLAIPFYGHADYSVDELKKISCPVRAFYGDNDEGLINSLPALRQKMQEAGVDYEAKVYPNCGHAFFNDTNRFAYNKEAAEDAWKLTLKYLQQHVVID